MKEFRWLAFKGVADELKQPSDEEQSQAVDPQRVHEDTGDKQRQREENRRNAESMAYAVCRMLMARSVLRDPLLVGASAQHADDDITQNKEKRLADSSASRFVIGRSGHLKSGLRISIARRSDGQVTRCSISVRRGSHRRGIHRAPPSRVLQSRVLRHRVQHSHGLHSRRVRNSRVHSNHVPSPNRGTRGLRR